MKTIEYLKKNGVDLNKCLELFGDIETYNETLKGFCKSLESKLKQLESYYNEEDMPNYAIYIHSIKSDCKYFGFMKLANIAFEHEMASKENNINFVKEHYKEIIEEATKVKNIVNEYLTDTNDEEAEPVDDIITSSTDYNFESAFTEINIDELPSGTILTDPETITIQEQKNDATIENIVINELTNNTNISEDIILVADDSEVVRTFVEKAFKNKYEIARAANGVEALDIIKQHENDNKIKAILLDLNMPKIDGFAVLDYMTENDLLEKMPVTIISGDSSKEAISKAFTYQIIDMLNKPFSEKKIIEVVEKTMNFNKR